jgi:hypothetical protein
MLDAAIADQLNLIVRPLGPNVWFIQLDDLKAEQMQRLAPAYFSRSKPPPAIIRRGWHWQGSTTRNLPAVSAVEPEPTSGRPGQRASPGA